MFLRGGPLNCSAPSCDKKDNGICKKPVKADVYHDDDGKNKHECYSFCPTCSSSLFGSISPAVALIVGIVAAVLCCCGAPAYYYWYTRNGGKVNPFEG